MKISSLKVIAAIETLAQLRATLRGLKRSSEAACKTIKAAGGGRSGKWVAVLRTIPEGFARHSERVAVELTRVPK